MDLQTLDAVVAAAELRNFRAAAQRLGVSGPTFTRLIKQAEQDCGFPLFERTAIGTFLTAHGRECLEHARELQAAYKKFDSSLRLIGAPRGGALSISCGPLATRTLLEPVIATMLRDRPGMHVKIHVSATIDPLAALMGRKIDVVIADLTHTPDFEGLEVALVPKREIFLYARPEHPVHDPSPRSIGGVLQYPIALPYFHRHWRSLIEQAIRAEGPSASPLPHIPQIECDDYGLISYMACNSDILTSGTRDTFALEVQTGRLREVALTSRIYWNLCVAKLGSVSFPELNEFWRAITADA